MVRGSVCLAVEFFILCLLVPGIIIWFELAPFMFFFLWAAALFCWRIFRTKMNISIQSLWRYDQVHWGTLRWVLLRWVVVSAAMYLFMLFYDPARIFQVPREYPWLLLMITFLYPPISALPQEYIFCCYFFRRYKKFFGEGHGMVLASAMIFAFAHMLYINPVAPTLSFFAGLIFAYEYKKYNSLALVTIEHSLYGISMFTIGLGYYFFAPLEF